MTLTVAVETGLVGVGYEGLGLDAFVESLLGLGVGVLADVRLTPVSRKPGFSKRALAAAVGEAGIEYLHYPELGNPRHNRAGYAWTGEKGAAARDAYRRMLAGPPAAAAMRSLGEAARSAKVAVLCFEADQRHCHRQQVLEALAA
ncbi:MAG: DUF488 domain-containing protein [Bifidobacteriaceae bacterium]|jgi:uncharacterized protein (DUF488 family)|nr:DUF488 domain-containing protein [Bifidobacteriaceae bacterium]